MRAIETIKNIWKIEDLRNRILTTILLVMVYRAGTYVVLPGIDPQFLTQLPSPDKRWSYGIVGYVFRRGVF